MATLIFVVITKFRIIVYLRDHFVVAGVSEHGQLCFIPCITKEIFVHSSSNT